MLKEYRALWIISTSGICLYHHSLETLGIDQNLIGGFISAILSFAQTVFTDQVSSFEMSLGRIYYQYSENIVYCLLSQKKAKPEKIQEFLQQVDINFSKRYMNEIKNVAAFDIAKFKDFDPPLLELLGLSVKEQASQDLVDLSELVKLLKEVSAGLRTYSDTDKELILKYIDGTNYSQTLKSIKLIESFAEFLIRDEAIKSRIKNITNSMLRERTMFL